MNTRTIYAESIQKLEAQIKTIQETSFAPTLAILFSSPIHDLPSICALFDAADIELFGSTTAGEILLEEIYSESIVAILLDVKKEHFKVISKTTNGEIYDTAFEIGKEVKAAYENPSILLASGGVTIDAEQIITAFEQSIEKNIPIFGGLAGDDLELMKTYSLSRHGADGQGIVVVVFDGEYIEMEGLAISGWEAIGGVHTITKADKNVIYAINNKPAYDVYVNYFGYFDDINLKGKQISSMSAQYPLQILREDGSTVLRSPMLGNNEDKTLVLAGSVKTGDKFRFSISPGFEVINQTIEEFSHLKDIAPEADVLIMFSCKGRYAALGPMIEDEIKGLSDYWNAPLIGFFSYGEFGNARDRKCDFHNETCSLVLLKEK